ncbi:MAG: hypothetical protein AAF800_11070 [Planctomycetota bacterium]
MAKQDLSRHQEGIVRRYYQNHETIQSTKLSELLSELWLAEDGKTQTRLWGKAQTALMRLGVDANRVASVVGKRDLEVLAKLIGQADTGKAQGQAGAVSGGTPHRGARPLDGSDVRAANARSTADQPGGARTIAELRAEKAAAAGTDSLEEDNLKRALKAFRRKLKNYRRDDESRLGSKYVTSGKPSAINAIEPPREYPPAVWNKLVELGRLKRGGGGTYELP